MPTTEILKCIKSSSVGALYNDHISDVYTIRGSKESLQSNPKYFMMGFTPPAIANRGKIITRISLFVYGYVPTYNTGLYVRCLHGDFNESDFLNISNIDGYGPLDTHDAFASVAVRNQSSTYQWYEIRFPEDGIYGYKIGGSGGVRTGVYPFLSLLMKNGLTLYTGYDTYWYSSNASENKPYLVVEYSDTEIQTSVTNCSPASGYVPKHRASRFSWDLSVISSVSSWSYYATPEISNTVFQYKYSASGTVTEIQCGAVNSKTIQAETFTGNTVFWRVKVTNSLGTDNYSDWMQLSTVEATSSAVAISPKNIMADGSAPIPFEWSHIISTGTAQTEAELQKSQNGSSWSTLATVEGSNTSTSIPAGTFTAGQWYWRVRTYNSDGTAGSWSDAVSFIVVSAPDKPTVTTNGTPRPTISWQSTGQQGYQVSIVKADTSESVYDSGTVFGTANSMKLPKYLDDGSYAAKVRVVNSYSLWSDYGTAALTVENTPGEDITLSIDTEDGMAQLSWTTEEEYDSFIVYRDGVPVSKSPVTSFTDYLNAGEHRFFVRGVYNDSDNYGVSDTVTATAEVEILTIIDTETSEATVLKYSESSMRNISIYEADEVYLRKFCGAAYPVPEKSGFKSKTISFDAAFKEIAEVEAFEKLIGKVVCVKKGRNAIIGVLSSATKKITEFYTSLSCSVSQIHFDEEVTV